MFLKTLPIGFATWWAGVAKRWMGFCGDRCHNPGQRIGRSLSELRRIEGDSRRSEIKLGLSSRPVPRSNSAIASAWSSRGTGAPAALSSIGVLGNGLPYMQAPLALYQVTKLVNWSVT